MTDYPSQDAIREYISFLFTVETIARDEHKRLRNNREISDLSLDSVLKITATHFGKMTERTNGNFYSSSQQQSKAAEQSKNQPAQQQKAVEPKTGWKSEILRLLNEFPQNLERKSQSKIKIVKEIPRSDWNNVKEGFEKEGWRYDWREKAFLIPEEMKA